MLKWVVALTAVFIISAEASENYESTIRNIYNITLWKEIAPNMHISDEIYQNNVIETWKTSSADEEAVDDMVSRLIQEGYFLLPPPVFNLPFHSMITVMDTIHDMSLPVVFCMLYDEFWLPFARVHRLLEALLGPGYLRLPDFWAWRIDHTLEESGWGVHADKNSLDTCSESGLPCSLTIWIPLADVTTDNSCMYVLPADRDPTYNLRDMRTLDDLHWADFITSFRALPAEAGSVLGWNSRVYHFGSRASRRAKTNRYSLSFEFQAGMTLVPDAVMNVCELVCVMSRKVVVW